MEKQQRAALVYAGPVSRGDLTRLPGLPDQLAFIKSSSIPTASRAVKALRAGRAVKTYEELASADLMLISVPEPLLRKVVGELVKSKLDWRGRTAVLFDSSRNRRELDPLAALGATTASLDWSAHPERFLIEGHPDAIRRVKTLLPARSLIVLSSKAVYREGLQKGTKGFYPLFAEAIQCFQSSGLDKATAETTAVSLFAESARVFLRSGKRLLKTVTPQSSLPEG